MHPNQSLKFANFWFWIQTVNDLIVSQLDTKKISNIKKMLNTFDGLLIAFEYYHFASSFLIED